MLPLVLVHLGFLMQELCEGMERVLIEMQLKI